MSQPTPEEVHVDTSDGGTQRRKRRKETDVTDDKILEYAGLVKAKYDTSQLEALKAKGHTYPGTTSYPIDDADDLDKAVHAVGRGKVAGHDKIRAYIKRRAGELGKPDAVPDDWGTVSKEEDVRIDDIELWKSADQQIVYGVVLEPDLVDSQGDIVDAAEIEKAAHRYLTESRKSDIQHSETPAGVEVIESYIAPHDMVVAGHAVTKGSWVMAHKITDPDVWQRVLKGELTGLSIGGNAVRVPEPV